MLHDILNDDGRAVTSKFCSTTRSLNQYWLGRSHIHIINLTKAKRVTNINFWLVTSNRPI